ncbi:MULTISPECIES: M81 family metallopeptidase [unclassified Bradyrhizobium]|uniref:M81 family metallopeptidase n=1 Tax=unclassified Bradyrhizobium TaxID=2631580 RepID=UPI00339AC7FE
MAQLAAARPLDSVLLGLNGAMVAHGYDDVGDILERVRGSAALSASLGRGSTLPRDG